VVTPDDKRRLEAGSDQERAEEAAQATSADYREPHRPLIDSSPAMHIALDPPEFLSANA
jgi:hypothetical protein